MLNTTKIEAINLIIEQIDKLIEKNDKKASKEKQKKQNASVTYKGETYYSDADLQDAYACDAFSSATYDRLIDKLNKARGNVESYEMTPSEMLVMELRSIKDNYEMELAQDRKEKKLKEERESRFTELQEQGYSYREAETIIGNEELMRYE